MLAKAAMLPADEIVVDLEDSVEAGAKEETRDGVVKLLADGEFAGRAAVAVRVNGLDTPWWLGDVESLAATPGAATSLVVPKVESGADLERVGEVLAAVEAGGPRLRLQALIETAAGLQRTQEIAAASGRLEALILGYADLRASLGRPPNADETAASWQYAQETVLVAARVAGVQAIDGPYLRIEDDSGLRRWAAHARALGYDGKWAIHPAQLGVLNEVFAPSEEELERARTIIAALRTGNGQGAVKVEGEMVDEASRKLAEHVLARAEVADA
jgi:citrate lyase subunit beta/citryl-CoA lyase